MQKQEPYEYKVFDDHLAGQPALVAINETHVFAYAYVYNQRRQCWCPQITTPTMRAFLAL